MVHGSDLTSGTEVSFCSQDPSKSSRLTHFTHAVANLPSYILPQVPDVISAAPNFNKPCVDMKIVVLKRLQSSITTHLKELVSKEELGDEKTKNLSH